MERGPRNRTGAGTIAEKRRPPTSQQPKGRGHIIYNARWGRQRPTERVTVCFKRDIGIAAITLLLLVSYGGGATVACLASLVGWLDGWLAGSPAGWPACWLAGLVARRLAGLLAGLLAAG